MELSILMTWKVHITKELRKPSSYVFAFVAHLQCNLFRSKITYICSFKQPALRALYRSHGHNWLRWVLTSHPTIILRWWLVDYLKLVGMLVFLLSLELLNWTKSVSKSQPCSRITNNNSVTLKHFFFMIRTFHPFCCPENILHIRYKKYQSIDLSRTKNFM